MCTQKATIMTIQELEQWIARYGKEVYSFCLHLTLHKELAEDLYQDTFLTAMKKLPMIREEENPKGYLLTIAFRIWKNQTRKLAWRNRIAPQLPAEAMEEMITAAPEDGAEGILKAEEKQMLWRAVRGLPEKRRVPILLYYMEELSLEEISKILSIPQGTVKSRLYHARKQMAQELEEYFS